MVSKTGQLPVAALALIMVLWGQGAAGVDTGAFYEDAQGLYAEGDRRGALIQLKNSLAQNSQDVSSLLLMGEIQLELGEAPEAEFAFGQALLLGADPAYVTPRLAEAYLVQRNYRKILQELNPDQFDGSTRSELLGYRAFALIETDESSQARQSIELALRTHPRARVPNIVRARTLLRAGSSDEALAVGEMLVDNYPNDARSWSLYGDALYATGLEEDALSAYSLALDRNPHLISARLARAAILAGTGEVERASVDVDFVREQFPYDPRAAYLKAELLEASGQHEQALGLYEEVTQLLSLAEAEMLANDTQLTVMVAVAHIKSGQLQQARKYLEGYQANNVDNVTTGKVLARLQLQQGDATAALEVLAPLLAVSPDDQELLELKARSYTALENYKRSITVWRQIKTVSGDSIEASAQIAVNQILDGSLEEGIAGLEQVLRADGSRVNERAVLARSYLQQGNHDAAVRLAEKLVEQEPDRQEFRNLLGRAYMYAGNYVQAQLVLEGAVAAHPEYFPARMSLTEVQTIDGDLEAARAGLQLLLKEFPDRADVLLQQARVDRLSGDLSQARKYAEQSVLVDGESLDARKFLVTVLLEGGNAREAELLAEQTAAKFHERADAQVLLAQTLVGVGKSVEARTSLKIASRRADSDHAQLYQIARLQIEIGALPEARASLGAAIAEKPDVLAYREAEIEVELRSQNYPGAMELAKALVTAFPEKTGPLMLFAAALSGQGLLEEALQQYALAQELAPNDTSILVRRYRTLMALDNRDEAEVVLTTWLKDAPEDPLVNYAYAEFLMEQERWEDAEKVLVRMNTLQPNNPILLNNMAYIQHALSRPDALDTAMRAYELAPQTPQINDTVGWILVGLGRAEEGLPYLREAVARQADSAVIRYHLAVALNDMGRPREAARALAIALQQREPFPGREEAEKLLATIQ